jgi:peptide/nickel transport system ATP-binding protein
MTDALLSVRNLTTHFHTDDGTVRAVDGVDFDVRRGETVCVVGESGSGKTVTAESVARLVSEPPGEIVDGEIRFDGRSVLDMTERELESLRGGRIGYVFQNPRSALNPVYTVGWQIREAIQLHEDASDAEARARAVDLLERVGIPDAATRVDDYPHEFSGGMTQRVAIAMALAAKPDLLVADEPTTALDATTQMQILRLLADVQEEFGTGILLITHDLGVVAEVADRVLVMYAGKVMERGDVYETFERPSHPYTRALLDCLPGRGAETTAIGGSLPAPTERTEGCRFHPRCPHAAEECREGDQPPMHPVDGDHGVSCVHFAPGADPSIVLGEGDERSAGGTGPGGTGPGGSDADGTDGIGSDAGGDYGSRTPLLDVRNLEKHYPVTEGVLKREVGRVRAVDGISFTVDRGETVGLVGESGCGKSTVATTLLRLEEPTGGRVLFEGRDVDEFDDRELKRFRREAQMIFQDPASSLDPRMSVGESVGEPLRVHGVRDGERRRRIAIDLLERVGLSAADVDRYPHEFSEGQKQRIGLARALVLNPSLLVADEPVSALDVSVQAEILSLTKSLQREFGLGVLFISHDLSVIREVCDRVAVMYLGRIVELADADDLFSNPRHPYTRALLSSIPARDPTKRGRAVELSGDVPNPSNPPAGCRFHTRCPEVIPPEGYDFERSEWRAVMDLRVRLERAGVDAESVRRVAAADRGVHPDSVSDGAVRREIRREFGVPETLGDDRAERALSEALEALVSGDGSAARERMREAFETPCGADAPDLRRAAEGHRAACHLVDEAADRRGSTPRSVD